MIKNKSLFSLLILIVIFAVNCHSRQLTLRNGKFYDFQNRQITFHGTNIVVKVPPYIPTFDNYNSVWSFGPQDIQNLKQNGFNAIRLGVMWAGVQPSKDGYNQTYLNEMLNIVNAAGKQGIYTLIEFHQDLLSETFCGDGIPIWLIKQFNGFKSFPMPLNKKSTPDHPDCHLSWSDYYFTFDVGRGFAQLYDPKHQYNKRFLKYWQKVALTFKGNPYVIAYELINQPWIGDIWRNPVLVVPSMAQRMKLQGLYDQLSLVIRKADEDTPLCFQPVTFDNFVPSGFSHVPGGNKYKNQSVLCFHYYQPPALSLIEMDTYVRDAKKLGIGSLISETYAGVQTLDRAEIWKQGWMYWIYKDFGGMMYGIDKQTIQSRPPLSSILTNESLRMDQALIRTYFQRVAGQLIESRYNSSSKQFSATYWADPFGSSVLFLSTDRVYSNGYTINVYPDSQVTVQKLDNFATITYTGQQRRKKILVTVSKL